MESKAKFRVRHRALAKEVDPIFYILGIHSYLISVFICYQNQNIQFGLFAVVFLHGCRGGYNSLN